MSLALTLVVFIEGSVGAIRSPCAPVRGVLAPGGGGGVGFRASGVRSRARLVGRLVGIALPFRDELLVGQVRLGGPKRGAQVFRLAVIGTTKPVSLGLPGAGRSWRGPIAVSACIFARGPLTVASHTMASTSPIQRLKDGPFRGAIVLACPTPGPTWGRHHGGPHRFRGRPIGNQRMKRPGGALLGCVSDGSRGAREALVVIAPLGNAAAAIFCLSCGRGSLWWCSRRSGFAI